MLKSIAKYEEMQRNVNFFIEPRDVVELFNTSTTPIIEREVTHLSDDENPLAFKEQVWDPLEFSECELENEPKARIPPLFYQELKEKAVWYMRDSGIDPDIKYPDGKVWGSEVGDDRVDASVNPFRLAMGLAAQSMIFGMETSEYDTFISNFCYNFCEITTGIPCSPENSYGYARKTSMENVDFIDVPPIKILLPVSKGKSGDFSSSKTGKSSMLASKMNSANPRTCKWKLHLASLFADSALNTRQMNDPKYLPSVMGGCNAPPLFENSWNTYAYVQTYNGGDYSRVYGTASAELKETIERLDRGFPAEAIFCSRLRQKQEYLFGTYKEHVAIPPHSLVDEVEGMPKPIYTQQGPSAKFASVEQRLMRAKRLLPRSAALVHFQSAKRLADTIMGITPVIASEKNVSLSFKRRRAEFEGALSANTAFKRLLDRRAVGNEIRLLSHEKWLIIHNGQRGFTPYDAEWLAKGKGEIYSLSDLPTSEDMFLLDEVSVERTMRVPGILLRPIANKVMAPVVTRAKLGLWQVSQTIEEWADATVKSLKEERERLGRPLGLQEVEPVLVRNREFTSDDPYILHSCIEDCASEVKSQTIFVISSDKKLCRRISQLTSDFVVRLEPALVIAKLQMQNINYGTQFTVPLIESILPENFCQVNRIPPARRVYVDTGSLEANAIVLGYKRDESRVETHRLIFKDLIDYGNDRESRFAKFNEVILDNYAVRCKADIYWPNTIQLEFDVSLQKPRQAPPRVKVFAETPRRWISRYLS
jgi:hypothetical protein